MLVVDTLDVESYSRLIERMNAYEPELPRHILSQAVGMQGDRTRLERVMAALIRGDPVKIVLMGGSLSLRGWNYPDESFIRQVHKWLELTFIPGCREEAQAQPHRTLLKTSRPLDLPYPEDPRVDQNQDLHVVSNPVYLSQGSICPKSSSGRKIELLTLTIPEEAPSQGPGYIASCLMNQVPADSDLVLLDLGGDDSAHGHSLDHPERRAYERLLRKALGLKGRPAVVDLEAFSWVQSGGRFHKSDYFDPGPRRASPPAFPGTLAQDKHKLLTEYYAEVQVLSVRAALFSMMNGTMDPDRLIHLGPKDLHHLSLVGHRWLADIVIQYFQRTASNLAALMLASEELRGSKPKPWTISSSGGSDSAEVKVMSSLEVILGRLDHTEEGNEMQAGGNTECGVETAEGQVLRTLCSEDFPGILPPPFFSRNYEQSEDKRKASLSCIE